MAYSFPGRAAVTAIFAIWLRMNLKEPGIRKSKRISEKIASVNACVRKYIKRDVYQANLSGWPPVYVLDKAIGA